MICCLVKNMCSAEREAERCAGERVGRKDHQCLDLAFTLISLRTSSGPKFACFLQENTY